jgi:hypothetical protein
MILYHGSNTAIEAIDFDKCKPFKDFGCGFYLTEIEQQAKLMARRTASIYGGEAVVSVFEFDESAALNDSELSVKRFDEPDEEWALFVMNNRSRTHKHPCHEYDLVIGPVADDTIATLFRNFDDGIIDLTTLVSGLKFKKISSQYFFHSRKAVAYLQAL